MVKKQEAWTRDPNFKKYFGTVFGITKVGNGYRLDIGNERIQMKDEQIVNIAECQIILPKDSFNALVGLLNKAKKEIAKSKKK